MTDPSFTSQTLTNADERLELSPALLRSLRKIRTRSKKTVSYSSADYPEQRDALRRPEVGARGTRRSVTSRPAPRRRREPMPVVAALRRAE